MIESTSLGEPVRAEAPEEDAAAPIVRCVNVSRVYGPAGGPTVPALDQVSLELARGACTAVTGRSGSGKSTLLHLLAGIDRATEGQVLVDGHDVGGLDDAGLATFRRTVVGVVFQSFHLLDELSVHNNVAMPALMNGMPRRRIEERVEELFGQVGLEGLGHRFPGQLSGGQRQRVAIARALVNDPPILLADEPTGNLDSGSGTQVMALLREVVKGGRTLIIVTHDPQIADAADHQLQLADGKIVAVA